MAAAGEDARTLRASRRSTPAIPSASHRQGLQGWSNAQLSNQFRGGAGGRAVTSILQRRRIQIGTWSRGLATCGQRPHRQNDRRHESSIRVHITARNAQASANRLCTTALTGILRRACTALVLQQYFVA